MRPVDEYFCSLYFDEKIHKWEINKYKLSGGWFRLVKPDPLPPQWKEVPAILSDNILACKRCKHKMICLLDPHAKLTYEKPSK